VRRPVQSAGPKAGARHRLQAAKIELEEPNSISRVSPKIFWLDYFPRLILGCSSCSAAPQPGFGIAKQPHQPAPFFADQGSGRREGFRNAK
jgi:hypothetical protein